MMSPPSFVHRRGEPEVTQANDLARAAQEMSLNEKRLLSMAISNLDPSGPDMTARIYVNDFNRYFTGGGKDSYRRLREAASALMQRVVFIDRPGSSNWDAFHWVSSAHYRGTADGEGGAFIDVVFEKALRPKLVDLKANFHSYQLSQLSNLNSFWAVRMYEILLHESHGGRKRRIEFGLDELKWRLRLRYRDKNNKLVNKYPDFKNFRVRVLEKAQSQCNAYTDLSFEFEPIKEGRRVARIAFDVSVINSRDQVEVLPAKRALTPHEAEVARELEAAGFVGDGEDVVLEYGEDVVRRTLAMAARIVKEAAGSPRPIHNPGGLIQRLLKTGAVTRELDEEKGADQRVDVREVADALVNALSHARTEHAETVWEFLPEDEQAELHDAMRVQLTKFEVDILNRASWEGSSYVPLRNRVLFEQNNDLFTPELASPRAFAEHTGMLEEYGDEVRDAILKAAAGL